MIDYEFYATPDPFTRWLAWELEQRVGGFTGASVYEPCAGAGDIGFALDLQRVRMADLDPFWGHPVFDATKAEGYALGQDWSITNPPFSQALPIAAQMFQHSRVGVAMYHRATLKEPLKGHGLGRSFFRDHPPTMTLWCPRFAHQRSKTTGKWSTDSVTCVWSVWKHGESVIGDVWPPDSLFAELERFTPLYRERMDALMAKRKAA